MPIATEFSTAVIEEVIDISHKKNSGVPTDTSTILFLDWDDTLLCTSVLSQANIKLDSSLEGEPDLVRQLDELSNYIIDTLTCALSHGDVHIVTNGETGWVQLSAAKFVPRVVPILEKVTILSARSTFEKQYPGAPMEWKFRAFEQSLVALYSGPECLKNVISFGDSHAEREAILAVTKGLPHTTTKSIKFAEIPSIEQLTTQLKLTVDSFQSIVDHDGDLDLCMSLSATETAVVKQ